MRPCRRTACVALVLLVALAAPPAASAADSSLDARVDQEAGKVSAQCVEVRHTLHLNPELSNREAQTSELVAAHLRSLGLEPRTGVAKYGVVALLQGGKPGPLIAVRADMDALPVIEQTDLPFASKKEDTFLGQEVGVAHACGHDVHTSVLMGTASVLTVGIVRGGERFNIIPGEAHLEGTVRTYKQEVRDLIERRMREILDGIARGNGGTFEMEYQRNAPATVNDPELAARVRPLLERIVGADNVKIVEPSMAGEDFAYFANQAPGFFYRLGVVAPGTTSGGLHTPTFRADDSAVPAGIRIMSRLLVDYLSENHSSR